jgi:hypothetical protein
MHQDGNLSHGAQDHELPAIAGCCERKRIDATFLKMKYARLMGQQ